MVPCPWPFFSIAWFFSRWHQQNTFPPSELDWSRRKPEDERISPLVPWRRSYLCHPWPFKKGFCFLHPVLNWFLWFLVILMAFLWVSVLPLLFEPLFLSVPFFHRYALCVWVFVFPLRSYISLTFSFSPRLSELWFLILLRIMLFFPICYLDSTIIKLCFLSALPLSMMMIVLSMIDIMMRSLIISIPYVIILIKLPMVILCCYHLSFCLSNLTDLNFSWIFCFILFNLAVFFILKDIFSLFFFSHSILIMHYGYISQFKRRRKRERERERENTRKTLFNSIS